VSQRLAALDARPGRTILAGRAVAQAGLFAVAAAPVVVLSNVAFNQLTVVINVVALALVAPSGAFQQHLARVGVARDGVRTGLGFTLAVTLVLAAIATPAAMALTSAAWWVVLLVVGGVLAAVAGWTATVLAVRGRFGLAALVEAAGGLGMLGAAVVLLVIGAGLGWWAAVYALGGLIAVTIGLSSSRHAFGRTTVGGAGRSSLATLVRGAIPLLVIGVLAMAYNRADLLILEQKAPVQETTAYALAGRVVGPLLIALGSLNNSLYPLLLEPDASAAQRQVLCRRYARRLVVVCLALVPLSVLAALVAGAVSQSVAELRIVGPVFVLALATVPFAATVPWGFFLSAIGAERVWMVALASCLTIDVIAVTWFAHDRALTCAIVWLVVQTLLWLGMRWVVASPRWRDRPPVGSRTIAPGAAVT